MDRAVYKDIVSQKRKESFKKPLDRIYSEMVGMGLWEKEKDFIINNASDIILELREKAWKSYQEEEKNFNYKVLEILYPSKDELDTFDAKEALDAFIDKNMDHIYDLNLSNTQSRRVCAGSEFQYIIQFLLLLSEISVDEQVKLGLHKYRFSKLNKQIDLVVPGFVEHEYDCNNTYMLSLKTTLRERIDEVYNERDNTTGPLYLLTLDEKITSNDFDEIERKGIKIVTTKQQRQKFIEEIEEVIKTSDESKEEEKQLEHKTMELEKEYESITSELDCLEDELKEIKAKIKTTKDKSEKEVYNNKKNELMEEKKSLCKKKSVVIKYVKNVNKELDVIRKKIISDIEKRNYTKLKNKINANVMSFEKMLKELSEKKTMWVNDIDYVYEDKKKMVEILMETSLKYNNYPEIISKYAIKIKEFKLENAFSEYDVNSHAVNINNESQSMVKKKLIAVFEQIKGEINIK